MCSSGLGLIPPRIRPLHFWIWSAVVALITTTSNAWARSASQSVEVVARIEPELSLSIEPDTGERIDFGTIHSSPTESRLSHPVDVTVRVNSNLGHSYEVTQQLQEPLVSEEGAQLPPSQLLAGLRGASDSPAAALQAVGEEPETLIRSDPAGSPAAWSVSYQLQVPPDQPAGTYRGTVLMTVTAQ
ncbi:MAG: hypothetical protein HYZ92_00560 [Candidatus Omnitrophica bacterium]|nr:hypothetical protein [Candidatus Omnitrophota bacterium]